MRLLLPNDGGSSPDVVLSSSHRVAAPTKQQWTERRAGIEHLYTSKRWKLRRIMSHMETVYKFVASEQAYKKRLSLWAVHKNRSRVVTNVSTATFSASLTTSLGVSEASKPFLKFFTSVKNFSMMFFDSIPNSDLGLAILWSGFNTPAPPSRHGVNATFNLAFDLLDRNHGDLAGKMVRRGFLLLDNVLSLEGPALIWNLLGIMHCMIIRRNYHVFHMLLRYISGLAQQNLPDTHPATEVLRSLSMTLNAELATTNAEPYSSTARKLSADNSSLDDRDRSRLAAGYQNIAHIIKQAWILNAELVFSRFDPRLFPLYFGLNMHGSSMQTTSALFAPVLRWFNDDDSLKRLEVAANSHRAMLPTDRHNETLHPTQLLQDFDAIQADSIASLNQRSTDLLSEAVYHSQDTARSLQTVAALVTSKLIEMWPPEALQDSDRGKISPRQADHVACVMKALAPSRESCRRHGWAARHRVVEQRQCIVKLLEYAYGEVDPEVTGELWLLKEALLDAGRLEEAMVVEKEVLRRVEVVCRDLEII